MEEEKEIISKRDERRSKLTKILYAEKYIECEWVDKRTGLPQDKYDPLNSKKKEGTSCWSEKTIPGYFHQYVHAYQNSGRTVIIEKEDGDMFECSVDRIKFID